MTAEEIGPAVNYWNVFNALRRQRPQNLDTRKITGCVLKRISGALCFQQVVLVPSLPTQERGNYCHPKKGGARFSRGKVSLTALPFFTYCRLQESVLHGKSSRLHLGYIPANTVLQPWTLPAGMKLRLSTNLITRILKASYCSLLIRVGHDYYRNSVYMDTSE